MNDQEQLKAAFERYKEANAARGKAASRLVAEGDGFIDRKYLEDLAKAEKEWQETSNDFYSLLRQFGLD